jgi:hypothetical protein
MFLGLFYSANNIYDAIIFLRLSQSSVLHRSTVLCHLSSAVAAWERTSSGNLRQRSDSWSWQQPTLPFIVEFGGFCFHECCTPSIFWRLQDVMPRILMVNISGKPVATIFKVENISTLDSGALCSPEMSAIVYRTTGVTSRKADAFLSIWTEKFECWGRKGARVERYSISLEGLSKTKNIIQSGYWETTWEFNF